jgi:adenylate kinase family enzyme
VRRVVVVGPGAAGKSTLAVRLGEIAGLPVIELDKLVWRPGLAVTPRDQWAAIQRELARQQSWIMDGDLGPYDVVDVRLQAADTVVFLDFSPMRCAWRAIRRSRERADFWRWLFPIAAGAVRCSCRRSPCMPVTLTFTSSGPRGQSGDSSWA